MYSKIKRTPRFLFSNHIPFLSPWLDYTWLLKSKLYCVRGVNSELNRHRSFCLEIIEKDGHPDIAFFTWRERERAYFASSSKMSLAGPNSHRCSVICELATVIFRIAMDMLITCKLKQSVNEMNPKSLLYGKSVVGQNNSHFYLLQPTPYIFFSKADDREQDNSLWHAIVSWSKYLKTKVVQLLNR